MEEKAVLTNFTHCKLNLNIVIIKSTFHLILDFRF